MPFELKITVDFLASDHAPRMSLFSGRTDGVQRHSVTILPPVPWPWRHHARFHRPVRIERVPQAHLELAARRLTALLRVVGVPLLAVCVAVALVFAAQRWPVQRTAAVAYLGLAWTAAGVGYYLAFHAASQSVAIAMLDEREYLRVTVPDHLEAIYTAYQTAYDRWIQDGCPRHFADPADDPWGDEIDPAWDHAGGVGDRPK
ncbi:MAG: hypothetical protein ACREJ2_01690 [Planctomycetota bacterium]